MTITVRLPEQLEAELRTEAALAGMPISDFVRQAIAEKVARGAGQRASTLLSDDDVFGCIDSGRVDTSEHVEELVAEAINEKHRRRRRSLDRPVRTT